MLLGLADLAVSDTPTSAKVFSMACGLGFILFGGVFLLKADRVLEYAKDVFSRTGHGVSEHSPNLGQVRAFGFVFIAVGVMLVALGLILLLNAP